MSNKNDNVGHLVIIAYIARNLPQREIDSKQNPFVLFTLGETTVRTKSDIGGGQRPIWKHQVMLPVSEDNSELLVKVLNDDDETTDLISECIVDISDVKSKGEEDDWYKLTHEGSNAGEIYLELTFYKDCPPPQYQPLRYGTKSQTQSNHSQTNPPPVKSSTIPPVQYLNATRPTITQSFSTPSSNQPRMPQLRPPFSSSHSSNPANQTASTTATIPPVKAIPSIATIEKSLQYTAQSPISTHKNIKPRVPRTTSSHTPENPSLLSSSYNPTNIPQKVNNQEPQKSEVISYVENSRILDNKEAVNNNFTEYNVDAVGQINDPNPFHPQQKYVELQHVNGPIVDNSGIQYTIYHSGTQQHQLHSYFPVNAGFQEQQYFSETQPQYIQRTTHNTSPNPVIIQQPQTGYVQSQPILIQQPQPTQGLGIMPMYTQGPITAQYPQGVQIYSQPIYTHQGTPPQPGFMYQPGYIAQQTTPPMRSSPQTVSPESVSPPTVQKLSPPQHQPRGPSPSYF